MRHTLNKSAALGQAVREEDVKCQTSWQEPTASRFLEYRSGLSSSSVRNLMSRAITAARATLKAVPLQERPYFLWKNDLLNHSDCLIAILLNWVLVFSTM